MSPRSTASVEEETSTSSIGFVIVLPFAVPAGKTVPVQNQQAFRLAWSDINVSAYQNARARMLAVRNADLLFDSGHRNPELPTNPAFLLGTAEVTAASVVTPLIQRPDPQEITGASLSAALSEAVETLFPAAQVQPGTTATWSTSYAYELAKNPESKANRLVGQLPVALYPDQSLPGTPAALAGAVQAWAAANSPASAGGGWLFGVTLYSALQGSAHAVLTAQLSYRTPGS